MGAKIFHYLDNGRKVTRQPRRRQCGSVHTQGTRGMIDGGRVSLLVLVWEHTARPARFPPKKTSSEAQHTF